MDLHSRYQLNIKFFHDFESYPYSITSHLFTCLPCRTWLCLQSTRWYPILQGLYNCPSHGPKFSDSNTWSCASNYLLSLRATPSHPNILWCWGLDSRTLGQLDPSQFLPTESNTQRLDGGGGGGWGGILVPSPFISIPQQWLFILALKLVLASRIGWLVALDFVWVRVSEFPESSQPL